MGLHRQAGRPRVHKEQPRRNGQAGGRDGRRQAGRDRQVSSESDQGMESLNSRCIGIGINNQAI